MTRGRSGTYPRDVPLSRALSRLLPSRRAVPPEVRALALEPGERRLGWASTVDGTVVVATDHGLHLPGRDPLPWGQVARASWRPPVLEVTKVAEVHGTGPVTTMRLDDEGDLPQVVQAQVDASIVWSSHTRLAPGGGVRVVGRRAPGLEVFAWQLVYDQGTDLDDPLVRAQADALLQSARRSIG